MSLSHRASAPSVIVPPLARPYRWGTETEWRSFVNRTPSIQSFDRDQPIQKRESTMNELTICEIGIRVDAQGRYSLNDLHRAAGGENRHRPSLWTENQQTKALIEVIEAKAGIPAIESKQGLGTFVAKELVYAYGMWISPEFHLKVIQAYDAMMQGKYQPPQIPLDAIKLLPLMVRAARSLGLDTNVAAISANQAVTKLTGTNVMQLLGRTHLDNEEQVLYFTPTELGNRVGVSAREFNLLLLEAGLQVKEGERWVPSEKAGKLARLLDTGKRHNDGTMVQQVKWSAAVLSMIQVAA